MNIKKRAPYIFILNYLSTADLDILNGGNRKVRMEVLDIIPSSTSIVDHNGNG